MQKKYNSKEDLIVSESFLVENVLSESREVVGVINLTKYDQGGNALDEKGNLFDDQYGDLNNYYELKCGMETIYSLNVQPLNKNCPIKKLEFFGPNLSVTKGQKISAKIYKGEIQKNSEFDFRKTNMFYYLERDFTSKQNALEITLYDKKDNVVSISRSTFYEKYLDDSLFKFM